jgi:acyl dehydratase
MVSPDWPTVREGDTRELCVENLTRSHFVKYAGASGDFNPIHFDQTFASAAGLETVFGQGMFTAGVLSRVAVEWFGPESVCRYAVRFQTRIWPGDDLTCRGRVTKVYQEAGVPHADLALEAVNQKGETLVRGEATVRPWRG